MVVKLNGQNCGLPPQFKYMSDSELKYQFLELIREIRGRGYTKIDIMENGSVIFNDYTKD